MNAVMKLRFMVNMFHLAKVNSTDMNRLLLFSRLNMRVSLYLCTRFRLLICDDCRDVNCHRENNFKKLLKIKVNTSTMKVKVI